MYRNKYTIMEENQPSSQKATFIKEDEPGTGNYFSTGIALRQLYVLKQRSLYTATLDPTVVFIEEKEKGRILTWEREAEKLYPDEGDYIVNSATGTATFKGIL